MGLVLVRPGSERLHTPEMSVSWLCTVLGFFLALNLLILQDAFTEGIPQKAK